MSDRRFEIEYPLTFSVDPEIVRRFSEWSEPVKFRFENRGDGTVEMILMTVAEGELEEVARATPAAP